MKTILFSHEHIRTIASLIESGLSTAEVFEYMYKTFFKRQIGVFQELFECIQDGADFTCIFSYTNLKYVPLYMHLIASSQENGTMPAGLRDISIHMSIQKEYRQSLIQLLIYPVLVLIILSVLMLGILLFVVPQLKPIIFAGQKEIPFLTSILLSLSEFLTSNELLVMVIVFGTLVSLVVSISRQNIRIFLYRLSLSLPFISRLSTSHLYAQLSCMIFYYLQSGLSLCLAFGHIHHISYIPKRIRTILQSVESELSQGQIASTIFSYKECIPHIWTLHAKIGESKGSYQMAFQHISEIHNREVQRLIGYIQKSIEPILMICIGGIVGIFAYAILVPIYGLIQTLQ